MTQYNVKELTRLIGLDRVPVKGAFPAAWWITTHQELLDNYDKWKRDYKDHLPRVQTLADTLGVPITAARTSSWYGKTVLVGFDAPQSMMFWHGHPDHVPVPAGWRLDRKESRLVPSRKTKADRESQINKDFAAVKKIPDIQAYMTGLPMHISLQDRAMGGGTLYGVRYWRGHECVAGWTGADPDRCEDKLDIDTKLWHRQKLSALMTLRENAAETADA